MEALQVILEQLRGMGQDFLAHLPQFCFGLLVLAATWLLNRIIRPLAARVLSRFQLRASLVELSQKLIATSLWTIGLLAAALIVFPTVTPAKVLTTLGLGSIAIGFAFKDIFENFFAGVLILLREPFEIEDFIETASIEGRVEKITIRDTHLRQTDGQRVVIPNAQLFKNPVTVRTDLTHRRVTILCGVAYGEDVDHARDVIHQAVTVLDSVDSHHEVEIFAQAFGASSIDFEVTWWTGSQPVDIRRSRDQVVAAVKHALDDAGIEIPYPYRTLTFKEPLQLSPSEQPSHNNDRQPTS